MSRQTLGLLAASLILAATGYVQGTWTGRWQPVDLSAVSSRVYQVPTTIGDWITIDEGTYSDEELQIAELESYTMRHYRHRGTGDVVTMLLMCGRSGPVAVHPPTACYAGQGYEQSEAKQKHHVAAGQQRAPQRQHEFFTAVFSKPKVPDLPAQRIYWGWSTDGVWRVPDNPRLEFANSPVLFKLYVTQEAHQLLNEPGAHAAEQFLQDSLSVIGNAVSGTQVGTATHAEHPAD